MTRRLLILAVLLAGLGTPAKAAEDAVDAVVRQLRAQGYEQITVVHTLLGRVQITAIDKEKSRQREIVLNPHTGEILRDLRKGKGPDILDDDDDKDEEADNSGKTDDKDDDKDDDGGDSEGDGNSGHGGGDGDD